MKTPAKNIHARGYVTRIILIAIGWVSVITGVIGLFLPLVPTVPLLLLAATCFARSSEKFHRWLVEHDRLGPLVSDYLDGAGMPLRAKVIAIAMVWISVSTSAFIFVQIPWVRVVLIAIAVGITIYLLRLPTLGRQGGEP